jgi:hypothetical protein
LRKIFARDKIKIVGFFPAKRPPFIFVACLALSVMGTFAFAAVDLSAFDFRGDESIAGGTLTSVDVDYAIDCLNEYVVKAKRWASMPSRKSTRSITITPFGTLCAGIVASFSTIKITQPAKTPNSKNTGLLKLRI